MALWCRPTVIASQEVVAVDLRLELVIIPVSDVDRAKAFYLDKAGFRLDVDHRAGARG
ncbi:MAG: hypothetical protein ACRDOK_23885 [Streptosporangiaceae bacterium]